MVACGDGANRARGGVTRGPGSQQKFALCDACELRRKSIKVGLVRGTVKKDDCLSELPTATNQISCDRVSTLGQLEFRR